MGAIAVSFQNRLTGSSGTVCILNIGFRTLEFVRKKKKRKEESEIRIRNGCSNFRIFLWNILFDMHFRIVLSLISFLNNDNERKKPRWKLKICKFHWSNLIVKIVKGFNESSKLLLFLGSFRGVS